jgi:hypothetical protein
MATISIKASCTNLFASSHMRRKKAIFLNYSFSCELYFSILPGLPTITAKSGTLMITAPAPIVAHFPMVTLNYGRSNTYVCTFTNTNTARQRRSRGHMNEIIKNTIMLNNSSRIDDTMLTYKRY